MKKAAPWTLVLLLAAGTAGAEQALTVRATDLHSQGQSDAAVLASLPENARVEVLGRKGAWSQVRTPSGQSGWIRMLNLKPENAPSGQGGNALGAINSLLTAGRSSNTATVTTGVRGLSEEDLQRAQANAAEFEKMQGFGADRNAAQEFALRSGLAPVNVDELVAPGRSGERSQEGN
jgi:uncharacterized protein YgiM (DUF1202 family)